MARVIWTKGALEELKNLLEYIEHDSPLAARRFGQLLIDRVEQLQQSPNSGGHISEDESGVYRELLQGSYRIIYRVDDTLDAVYLATVHHAARLLDVEKLD